jgi:hypothetical protein
MKGSHLGVVTRVAFRCGYLSPHCYFVEGVLFFVYVRRFYFAISESTSCHYVLSLLFRIWSSGLVFEEVCAADYVGARNALVLGENFRTQESEVGMPSNAFHDDGR